MRNHFKICTSALYCCQLQDSNTNTSTRGHNDILLQSPNTRFTFTMALTNEIRDSRQLHELSLQQKGRSFSSSYLTIRQEPILASNTSETRNN